MRKRPTQLARLTGTTLGFIGFVGILVLVALIAQRHPLRLDLTQTKRYSLSEQSQKIVRSLKDDIYIKAFFQEGSRNRDQARDLLETYSYYSRRIHYQFIDPDRQPALARRYQIQTYGTLVLEGFGKSQTVGSADEESISNAILKLSQQRRKTVYFLNGHGERQIEDFHKDGYSRLKSALEKENFRVKVLNLLVQPRVPSDAAVLVIPGPEKPLLATEIEALRRYLRRRGSLVVMLEPFADGGLRRFLASYGVRLQSDIIVDTMSRVFGADYLMPVITQYGSHQITRGFNIACFFPTARSVLPAGRKPEGIELTRLASTSPYSWAETDYRPGQPRPPRFDRARDRKGPISVAVIAAIAGKAGAAGRKHQSPARPGTPGKARQRARAQLAVFGDCDFVSNRYFDLQGNSDLLLNTINFLAEQENLVSIQRPRPKGMPLTLSHAQGQLLFWIGLLMMPTLVLAAGLTVFRLRRKHR